MLKNYRRDEFNLISLTLVKHFVNIRREVAERKQPELNKKENSAKI